MKTVSAAKLRRAQEGAMAARPYAQMLTNFSSRWFRAPTSTTPFPGAAASAAG